MTTFGLSAFLRVLSLNPQPQRTALAKRLTPSGKPYDFHRSLRLRAKKLAFGDLSFEQVLASVKDITSAAERTSASDGLAKLALWLNRKEGLLKPAEAATIESPRGLFKVNVTPDFLYSDSTGRHAVHLWNTKNPKLHADWTAAVLSYFAHLDPKLNGLEVLSLRDGSTIASSPTADIIKLGELVMLRVERTLIEIRDVEEAPRPRPEDRPSAF